MINLIHLNNIILAVILLFSSITNIIDYKKNEKKFKSIKMFLVNRKVDRFVLKTFFLLEGILGGLYFIGYQLKIVSILSSILFLKIGIIVFITFTKNQQNCKCENKNNIVLGIPNIIKYILLFILSLCAFIFNQYYISPNSTKELFFIINVILFYQVCLEGIKLLKLNLRKKYSYHDH